MQIKINKGDTIEKVAARHNKQEAARLGFTPSWGPSKSTDTLEREDCGTGAGGFKPGNTCATGSSVKDGGASNSAIATDSLTTRYSIANEPTTPVDNPYIVDPLSDLDGDGITDDSRVGVGGDEVPPPPKTIPRLDNLTKDEREVESRFATAFEQDPDEMADDYFDQVATQKLKYDDNGKVKNPLAQKTFNTDDAKMLSPDYAQSLEAKGAYNLAVHQTANAIAKRAFLRKLDEVAKLPEGKRNVLVTQGGVAAGKGYAVGNAFDSIADSIGAVWDSAGEQNGTEMPWLQREFEKRGIKGTYVFVHTDPVNAKFSGWKAAVQRAKDKGRMVDARLYAESYVIGAENFEKFSAQHAGKAEFVILDNRGAKTKRLDKIPRSEIPDIDTLHQISDKFIRESDAPAYVKRGGTIGSRVWKKRNK